MFFCTDTSGMVFAIHSWQSSFFVSFPISRSNAGNLLFCLTKLLKFILNVLVFSMLCQNCSASQSPLCASAFIKAYQHPIDFIIHLPYRQTTSDQRICFFLVKWWVIKALLCTYCTYRSFKTLAPALCFVSHHCSVELLQSKGAA